MKQVSAQEFYAKIGPLDVTLDVQGSHPFKTVFKLRRGGVVGIEDGGAYFLTETALSGRDGEDAHEQH